MAESKNLRYLTEKNILTQNLECLNAISWMEMLLCEYDYQQIVQTKTAFSPKREPECLNLNTLTNVIPFFPRRVTGKTNK